MASFCCPRCFFTGPISPDARYCPRCGLPDPIAASAATSPLQVEAGPNRVTVLDRLALGSVCNIYRCHISTVPHDLPLGAQPEGIFKIARDARSNALLANETAVLRYLWDRDAERRFTPFLPQVQASVAIADAGGHSRQANVLRLHLDIRSPAELYSLAEVHGAYRGGLDPRHMAWIWRRLLNVLGYVHSQGVVHAAVLPMHVLVDPIEHKLVLIDWCCSAMPGNALAQSPLTLVTGGYEPWYGRQALRQAPTPGVDVALGVRCMIDLLGGDAAMAVVPPAAGPGLERYFQRCLGLATAPADTATAPLDAWKLLDEFDRLIEAMWGKRAYMSLAMPPKKHA